MILEKRRWFQVVCAVISAVIVLLCWVSIRTAIPASSSTPAVLLVVLSIGAFAGFNRLLELLLPLMLLKLWPSP